jgi:rhamnose utilization protein RhaD (predicted bifunctional aldolase and dehydrogenase)
VNNEEIYINQLVKISKYAGGRFDLVQAGGGNSSVKLDDGTMLIKASGFSMSDVESESGFCKVNIAEIPGFLSSLSANPNYSRKDREMAATEILSRASEHQKFRPSIETFLHSVSSGKFTLHTHPIALNMLLNKHNWMESIDKIYGANSVEVPYATPGIELTLSLLGELNRQSAEPRMMFLQNHGLIVTADTAEEVILLTENTVQKAEEFLGICFENFRSVSEVAKLHNSISGEENIAMLVTDSILNHADKGHFFERPFCPDSVVFCGICAVRITNMNDRESLTAYREKYQDLPVILLHNDNIYIIAKNIRKAKEKEDVLKFQILVLAQQKENTFFLEDTELAYLGNWEAEKYRQKL